MDALLSADQIVLRDTVRRYVAEKIEPRARGWDRAGSMPRAVFGELSEMGLLGVEADDVVGGAGLGICELVLVLEELARGDASVALMAASHALCLEYVQRVGTDAQRQRWLADLASGATIAACAIAGWADGASAIAAAPEGDGWRLDGSQHAIINGNVASLLLLVVDLGDAGEAAFAIPASTVGVSRRASGARLGARSADVADVKLEAARTDPDDRIGAADSVATLRARARILSGAVSTGVATAAVAAAQHYAGERHQFGQPIGRFQAVQNRIADAATELDAARLLVYRAAQTCASGRPCAGEAAMAAAFAGAAAVSATDHSLQIHGGMGFTDEVSAGRCYRDAITCAHLAGGRRSHSLEIARAMLATGG